MRNIRKITITKKTKKIRKIKRSIVMTIATITIMVMIIVTKNMENITMGRNMEVTAIRDTPMKT